jgi:hypothetical protein
MSKPTVAPDPRKGQVVTLHSAEDKVKLKYHPVLLSLSRAKASLWLLDALPHLEVPNTETRDWIRSMASSDLSDALKVARAEFVKAAELHRSAP